MKIIDDAITEMLLDANEETATKTFDYPHQIENHNGLIGYCLEYKTPGTSKWCSCSTIACKDYEEALQTFANTHLPSTNAIYRVVRLYDRYLTFDEFMVKRTHLTPKTS